MDSSQSSCNAPRGPGVVCGDCAWGGGFVVTAPGRLGAVCGDRVLGRLGLLAVTVLARLGACLW